MRLEVTTKGFMNQIRDLTRAAGLLYISPFYFLPSNPATLPKFFLPDSIMLISDITNVKCAKINLPDTVCDKYFIWVTHFRLHSTHNSQVRRFILDSSFSSFSVVYIHIQQHPLHSNFINLAALHYHLPYMFSHEKINI